MCYITVILFKVPCNPSYCLNHWTIVNIFYVLVLLEIFEPTLLSKLLNNKRFAHLYNLRHSSVVPESDFKFSPVMLAPYIKGFTKVVNQITLIQGMNTAQRTFVA